MTTLAFLKVGTESSGLFLINFIVVETYNLDYSPMGDPELAQRLAAHLRKENIKAELVSNRGLDHGVFIPVMTAFPKAKIPVLQMSISSSLDPSWHIAYGRALRSFRDEGILFIGSGQATHDLQGRLTARDGFVVDM